MVSSKFSRMGIDVKVPLSKVSLSKATGHTTLTYQNYRLENKLLQELSDEMFIIISNTVQSKISPFIKFTWEEQHHQTSLPPLYRNQLLFIIYIDIKQGLDS